MAGGLKKKEKKKGPEDREGSDGKLLKYTGNQTISVFYTEHEEEDVFPFLI